MSIPNSGSDRRTCGWASSASMTTIMSVTMAYGSSAAASFRASHCRRNHRGKTSMTVLIEPVGTDYVAKVRGVDLSKPLDKAAVDAIVEASDLYAVLVFH